MLPRCFGVVTARYVSGSFQISFFLLRRPLNTCMPDPQTEPPCILVSKRSSILCPSRRDIPPLFSVPPSADTGAGEQPWSAAQVCCCCAAGSLASACPSLSSQVLALPALFPS